MQGRGGGEAGELQGSCRGATHLLHLELMAIVGAEVQVEGVDVRVLQRVPALVQRLVGLVEVEAVHPGVVAQGLHLANLRLHLRLRLDLHLERVVVVGEAGVIVEVALEGGSRGVLLLAVGGVLLLIRVELVAVVVRASVVLPRPHADPAELVLARGVLAGHVVAAAVLLNRVCALGARLRVGQQPVVPVGGGGGGGYSLSRPRRETSSAFVLAYVSESSRHLTSQAFRSAHEAGAWSSAMQLKQKRWPQLHFTPAVPDTARTALPQSAFGHHLNPDWSAMKERARELAAPHCFSFFSSSAPSSARTSLSVTTTEHFSSGQRALTHSYLTGHAAERSRRPVGPSRVCKSGRGRAPLVGNLV